MTKIVLFFFGIIKLSIAQSEVSFFYGDKIIVGSKKELEFCVINTTQDTLIIDIGSSSFYLSLEDSSLDKIYRANSDRMLPCLSVEEEDEIAQRWCCDKIMRKHQYLTLSPNGSHKLSYNIEEFYSGFKYNTIYSGYFRFIGYDLESICPMVWSGIYKSERIEILLVDQ